MATHARADLIATGYGQYANHVLRGALEASSQLTFTDSEVEELIASWLATPDGSADLLEPPFRTVVLPIGEDPQPGEILVRGSDNRWSSVVPTTFATSSGFRGAWAASTAYKARELVIAPSSASARLRGRLISANTDFTSGSTFSASNWTLAEHDENFLGAWAANTAYTAGQVVSYLGVLYSANADFTSAGSFIASNWTVLSGVPVASGVALTPVADLTATDVQAGFAQEAGLRQVVESRAPLSPAQAVIRDNVADSYPALLAGSLTAAWRLNEASGAAAVDANGVSSGVYTGGFTLNVAGPAATGDSGVLLNGSTGYIAIPDNPALRFTTSMSLDGWVKPTAAGISMLYVKGATANPEQFAYIDAAGKLIWNGVADTGALSIAVGVWSHFAIVWSGGAVKFYVNGVLNSVSVGPGSIPSSTNGGYIGRRSDGYYMNGAVSGFGITGAVLTQAQVSALANATTRKGAPPSAITGGVTVAADGTQSVLLTGQTAPAENGPWVITAGAWTRPREFATGLVTGSRMILVSAGNSAGVVFTLATGVPITVGTTAQLWVSRSKLIYASDYGMSPSATRGVNTTAMQAALAAAAAFTDGSRPAVILQAGYFNMIPRLEPASGVSILGPGQNSTTLDFTTSTADVCIFGPNNNHGATFKGFYIRMPVGGCAAPRLTVADLSLNNYPGGALVGSAIGLITGPSATLCVVDDIKIVGGSTGCALAAVATHRLTNCIFRWSRGHNLHIDGGIGAGTHSMAAVTVENCLIQNVGQGGDSQTADEPANIRIASSNGILVNRVLLQNNNHDEPLNTASVGSTNIDIVAAVDTTIADASVSLPVGVSTGNQYGIRVRAGAVRTRLRNMRVEPWITNDASRIPTRTILIEAGATDTLLEDVTTDPNAANGGGDILDLGTRTVWRNVVMNGGPAITTIQKKAGVPSDADWTTAPPIGTQILDTTDGKIYYRTAAATWKAATLA